MIFKEKNFMKLKILITLLVCVVLITACSTPKDNVDESSKDDNTTSTTTTLPIITTTPQTTPEKPPIETPINQFEFEAGEGGYTVTKYLGSDKRVVIPSVVDNKKVVDLNANVFGGNIVLEEITLSEYMTILDLGDFLGCDNLKVVTYPGEIESAKGSKGPKNITTLNLVGWKEIDLDDIYDIKEIYPSIVCFDLSGAEIIHEASWRRSTTFIEGCSFTISDNVFNDIYDTDKHLYEICVYENDDFVGYNRRAISFDSALESYLVDDNYIIIEDSLDNYVQLNAFFKNKGLEVTEARYNKHDRIIMCKISDGEYVFLIKYEVGSDFINAYKCISSPTDPKPYFFNYFFNTNDVTVNGTRYIMEYRLP